jgi:hypothetical protein
MRRVKTSDPSRGSTGRICVRRSEDEAFVPRQLDRPLEAAVGSLAGSTGAALRREPTLQGRQGGGDEKVLGHAVPEGQGEDTAKLGIVDPERSTTARPISALDEIVCQVVDVAGGVEEERCDIGGATLPPRGSNNCRAQGDWANHYSLASVEGAESTQNSRPPPPRPRRDPRRAGWGSSSLISRSSPCAVRSSPSTPGHCSGCLIRPAPTRFATTYEGEDS